jgi:hypothetical protein
VDGKFGALPGETVIEQRQGDALGEGIAMHPAVAEVPICSFKPTIPRLATDFGTIEDCFSSTRITSPRHFKAAS